MARILIASQNSNKIAEIAPILEQAGFEVTDARSHDLPEPVEDSGTFIGNARIKAKAAMEATGMAVVADDSGIIIDALGDFPGVETAPYAKSLGGYPQAVADIFSRLDGKSADCHYICILLVVFPDGSEIIATGKVHGHLIREPRGSGNFGFDPWFELKDSNKTFAEITPEEKHRISHRGLALQDLLRQLKEIA
jgi:XTP/dITP diphosphohydrolase